MLSLVVPVFKEEKEIEKFLIRLSNQTSKNFEVVFVVDSFTENPLKAIDKYSEKIKDNVKIIFNSKRIGRTPAIKLGISKAIGTHIFILTPTDFFKDSFIDSLEKIIEKNNSDIIEIDARLHKPIWLQGKPRKILKLNEKITNKAKIFAYTYPFEFNKIFRSELLKKVVVQHNINPKPINSIYSVEIVFRSILNAKSFSVSSRKIIRIKRRPELGYNPIQLNREWLNIIENESFKEYRMALQYNRYFTNKVIYSAITASHKKPSMSKRFEEYVNSQFTDEFFETNEFMLLNDKEALKLKEYRTKNNNKLQYKEF